MSPNSPAAEVVPTRRERARAATIEEIKQTALRLMRSSGSTDVRFSDIAREMGMTAPALYRYFDDADALVTELIVDAYDALGDAVAANRDAVPADDLGGRYLAVSQGYRAWARAEPQQFSLILGMPMPGYAAPAEGPTTEAAKRAMSQLKSLFFEAAQRGVLGEPAETVTAEQLIVEVQEDEGLHSPGFELSPATFQAMLNCWASLHGFTCLEAYGHLDFLPEAARDAIFRSTVRLAALNAGLPAPPTIA